MLIYTTFVRTWTDMTELVYDSFLTIYTNRLIDQLHFITRLEMDVIEKRASIRSRLCRKCFKACFVECFSCRGILRYPGEQHECLDKSIFTYFCPRCRIYSKGAMTYPNTYKSDRRGCESDDMTIWLVCNVFWWTWVTIIISVHYKARSMK